MGCLCSSQPWESKNSWLFLYLPLPPDFLMYFREGWGLCKHRCNFRECPEVLSINRRCQGDRRAWSLPLLGEDWEGTWCVVNCHEHRPRGCPPHTRAAAAAAAVLLLSSWNVALQKYHRWGTRPLPNTHTAFRKNPQHPLIFHPLSDINAIPHLRVQTPKPRLAVELHWAEPVLLCHLVHSSFTLPNARLHLCPLRGLLPFELQHMCHAFPFHLLQEGCQAGWEETAERSFLSSMRTSELGSQEIEKKKKEKTAEK